MEDGDNMRSETTHLYTQEELNAAVIDEILNEVYDALEERGYNPINQLVGYLMSGDPGYISSHKEARNKIMKLERTEIVELMVKNYISK